MEPRSQWLHLQGKDGGEIAQLYQNFLKDGPKRWTAAGYIDKKRKVLNELWVRFEKRHKKILGEPIYSEEQYLKLNCFEYTRKFFDNMSERLNAIEKQLLLQERGSTSSAIQEDSLSNPLPPAPVDQHLQQTLSDLANSKDSDANTQIEEDEGSLDVARGELLDFFTFIESSDIQCDEFDEILHYAAELFAAFEQSHGNLIKQVVPKRQSALRQEFFAIKLRFGRIKKKVTATVPSEMSNRAPSSISSEGEASVHTIRECGRTDLYAEPRDEHIYEDVDNTPKPATDSIDPGHNEMYGVLSNMIEEIRKLKVSSDADEIKVTRVSIPKFSGKQDEWHNFYDLFTSLVHEKACYNDATKMALLKTHVTNDAARIIENFSNIGANYNSAWQMLTDRFHNPKIMINNALDKLFKLKVVTNENSNLLKKLVDSFKSVIHTLRNLKEPVDQWNSMMVFMLTQRLPAETLSRWEETDARTIPQLDALLAYLERRISALEAVEGRSTTKTEKVARTNVSTSEPKTSGSRVKQVTKKCLVCDELHMIYSCPVFSKMSIDEREKFVEKKHLCTICLHDHPLKECRSRFRCHKDNCGQRHSSLLHRGEAKSHSCKVHGNSNATLPTARLTLTGPTGNTMTLRCLMDQGSMRSFISERAMQQLNLRRSHCAILAAGIGGNRRHVKGKASVVIDSIIDPVKSFQIEVLILPQLTTTNNCQKVKIYEGWTLADPEYFRGGTVDMIIGSDYLPEMLLDGLHHGNLLAQRTHLGWMLSGGRCCPSQQQTIANCNTVVPIEDNLSDALRVFWETEEKVIPVPKLSKEEVLAEEHYRNTTHRDDDGRYVCELPFKHDWQLGRSRHTALAFMKRLEDKFRRSPSVKVDYVKAVNDYIQKGHAVPVTSPETDFIREDGGYECYYLPHLAVIKEQSESTKMRIVFHASAPTDNKKSLNDNLLIGPQIQPDLVEKVIDFRMHRLVFVCDVEKMYRQIKMAEKHWNFQRFFWRAEEDEQMKEFALTTVTFGVSSAPFLAIRTLQKVAEDHEQEFPLAAKILKKSCYVDDVHHGARTDHELNNAKEQLIHVLGSCGFRLRKWSSNYPAILSDVPESHKSNASVIGFMGLLWNTQTDHFTFPEISLRSTGTLTKRELLSEIAKLFDPMGWLQPLIIPAKMLMQDIWKTTADWNDKITPDHERRWNEIRNEFQKAQLISVPRHMSQDGPCRYELHGFSDASAKAYGSCIYLRCVSSSSITSYLIVGKSRVAPIKPVSIPRLELKAALLMVDLMDKVKKSLPAIECTKFAWIDSQVALYWITSPAEKWKTFVRNRVSAIQEISPELKWNYVNTRENPADLISRGCNYEVLQTTPIWFHGPHWLTEDINFEPQHTPLNEEQQLSANEERNRQQAECCTGITEESWIENFAGRFSSWSRMVRVFATMRKFIKRCQLPSEESDKMTTPKEFKSAEEELCRLVQGVAFESEIRSLKRGESVSHNSPLQSITPFIDDHGTLRILGRLENAVLPYERKHPIVLPAKWHFSDILIAHCHHLTLHGGTDLTLCESRKNFWIVNGRQRVRAVLRNCVTCKRSNARTMTQLMGQLPAPRVNYTKPFLHTGCDFAGPILLKSSVAKNAKAFKAYIAVFVCLAVKAFHLELVGSLTTDSFIAALKRFKSRRGEVECLYTDNGTNFVGAFRKLKDLSQKMTVLNMEWKFIPPASPHFGGLWEAGVKSCKTHLKRTLSGRRNTWEEINTILCAVEATMNSRPLCALSNDINDLNCLTPGHFLNGSQYHPVPELNYQSMKMSSLRRWEACCQQQQQINKRYKTEYLSRLQIRSKWTQANPNLQVGQMILMKEADLCTSTWPLGRITEIIPGSDGLVRVVKVRTQQGEKTRPISKLCLLPVDIQDRPSDEKDKSVTEAPPKRPGRRPVRVNLVALLAIFTMIIACVGGAVITFDKPTPLHFKLDGSVQFIDHYLEFVITENITALKEDIYALVNGTTRLMGICSGSSDQPACERMAGNILHDTQLWTQRMNQAATHHRSRRVAPIAVGAVAMIVGATAGAAVTTLSLKATVAEFRARVEELDERQEMVLKTIQEQTAILDKGTMLVEKVNAQTIHEKAHHAMLWNATQRKLSEILARLEIQELLTFAEEIRDEMNEITSLHGSHERMLKRINISQIVASDQLFNDSLHSADNSAIFSRTSMGTDAIRFHFLLPITSPTIHALYRITVLPLINKDLIWLEVPLDVVAVRGDKLQSVNMERCFRNDRQMDKWICEATPSQLDDVLTRCVAAVWRREPTEDVCSTRRTPYKDTIIPLGERAWAYALKNPVAVGSETLMGSGLFSSSPMTITNSLIIPGTHAIYAPGMTRETFMDTATEEDTTDEDLTPQFQDLKESIHLMKTRENALHTTRHFTTLGLSASSIILAGALIIAFFCYTRRRRTEVIDVYRNYFGLH